MRQQHDALVTAMATGVLDMLDQDLSPLATVQALAVLRQLEAAITRRIVFRRRIMHQEAMLDG